jgi:hypothetical protein
VTFAAASTLVEASMAKIAEDNPWGSDEYKYRYLELLHDCKYDVEKANKSWAAILSAMKKVPGKTTGKPSLWLFGLDDLTLMLVVCRSV